MSQKGPDEDRTPQSQSRNDKTVCQQFSVAKQFDTTPPSMDSDGEPEIARYHQPPAAEDVLPVESGNDKTLCQQFSVAKQVDATPSSMDSDGEPEIARYHQPPAAEDILPVESGNDKTLCQQFSVAKQVDATPPSMDSDREPEIARYHQPPAAEEVLPASEKTGSSAVLTSELCDRYSNKDVCSLLCHSGASRSVKSGDMDSNDSDGLFDNTTESVPDDDKTPVDGIHGENKNLEAPAVTVNEKCDEVVKGNEEQQTDFVPQLKPPKIVLKDAYKEGQWSPGNPEGKKEYNRDFLLQLETEPLSMKKPFNLPNLDIIKKKAQLHRLTNASQRTQMLQPLMQNRNSMDQLLLNFVLLGAPRTVCVYPSLINCVHPCVV